MRRRPPEADAICHGLERDYREAFHEIGGGFSAWVSPTQIGVEALFGGRVGPLWQTYVIFGRRRIPFGHVNQVMTLAEAERPIRDEVEEYLRSKTPAAPDE
jgi:hypothetical protein